MIKTHDLIKNDNSLGKTVDFIKNNKIANKNRKGVKSEKIKIKTWFCDKDLSSLDSIN